MLIGFSRMLDISTIAWSAGYTFANALLSWIILFALIASLILLELGQKINLMCVARSLSLFGLFPYFVFGFVLFSMFPYDTDLFSIKIYLPQVACCVLTTAFPSVYAASAQYSSLDPRVRDLVQLAGSKGFCARRAILGPLCLPPAVVALKTGWPITVLMILLFEWGRGDQRGLGGALQGVISTGQFADIVGLVIPIVLTSGSVYLALDMLDTTVRRKLAIDALDLYGAERPKGARGRGVKQILCIIAGVLLFVALWDLAFEYSPLDASQKYGPGRFAMEVLSPTARLGSTVMSQEFRNAVLNSLELAAVASVLGTLVATGCAVLATKSPLFQHSMTALTQLTQAVPIFVFIPALFGLLRNTMLVALVILVSVTYFRAYEYIRGELATAYSGWRELLSLSGSSRTISAWISKFRTVEMRIMMGAVIRSVALVFPYSITAAVIADLFLNLEGMGRLASFEARGDVAVTVAVCLVMLAVGVVAEISATLVTHGSRSTV
jgi:sulfonate transport system permease protein